MRGISAVVGLVFFALLLSSVVVLYAVYTTSQVNIQQAAENRQIILQSSRSNYLRVTSLSYDGNYLTISFTALENGVEVNDISFFINHRFVGRCSDLNCSDETGNGYLVSGEGGAAVVPYSGPCEVIITLEYLGSTTSYSSNICAWHCRRKIIISSSFSEPGYPVHIELNTSNFDFTVTDGNDLRFTDESGTKLPYWIEYWTDSSASIWVKTDVSAGDTNIYMYYCNPSALSESNGYAVFTAFDFDNTNLLAVFHFDEGSGTITYDATGKYRGTLGSTVKWVKGKFGYALEFDEVTGVETDFGLNVKEITYVLWAKVYTQSEPFSRIIYDGNYSRMVGMDLDGGTGTTPYIQYSSTIGYATTALDDLWHSLVAKVSDSGGYQALWVDGVEEVNASIAYVSDRETNLYIGFDPFGDSDLNGAVDELIMYGRVLSNDEINALLSGYFDFLTSAWVVRKRIDPEPSVTIGPEETGEWVIT